MLNEIAAHVWTGLQQFRGGSAVEGLDLHNKFQQDPRNFDLDFGDLSTFFGGLEARVGTPNPNVKEAMRVEHCDRDDSMVEWTTRNYGITTTPKIEWFFVCNPSGGLGQADPNQHTWPREHINGSHPRQAIPLSDFDQKLEEKNALLRAKEQEELSRNEMIGIRLYTGPMFEKYNLVNRGGPLDGKPLLFMQDLFDRNCKGNRYTTTIHVINSALIKMSKVQQACAVYRGVAGG